MNIREIQIGKFRQWSQLSISELTPELNVIHVRAAGDVLSIPHFVRSILFGSGSPPSDVAFGALCVECRDGRFLIQRTSAAGDAASETLRILRDGDLAELNHAAHSRLVEGISEEVAAALFLDASDLATPEQQLGRWQQLGLTEQLFPAKSSQDTQALDAARRAVASLAGDCASDGLASLIASRARLLAEIGQKLRNVRQGAFEKTEDLGSDAIVSDLRDEIAELSRRQEPLAAAWKLRNKWKRFGQLRQRIVAARDNPAELEQHLEKLGQIERQRHTASRRLQRCQRLQAKLTAIKPRPNAEIENRLRQLLDQRDWLQARHSINDSPEKPESSRLSRVRPSPTDRRVLDTSSRAELSAVAATIRRLAAARREARQRHEQIARRLVRLEEQLPLRANGENGFPPPPSDETVDRDRQLKLLDLRLEVLDRQVHGLRAECRRWLRRQVLPMPMAMALAVLFGASVACAGGGMIFSTHGTQSLLVLTGLVGMVTAGTLKVTFEQSAGRRLAARRRELLRLNCEIEEARVLRAGLTLPEPDEQAYASDPRIATAGQQQDVASVERIRLQRQLGDAENNVRASNNAYGRALARYQLAASLTPAQAVRSLRQRLLTELSDETPPRADIDLASQSDDEQRIKDWRKAARRLLKDANFEDAPSRDVHELLDQLDACFQQQRQAGRERDESRRKRNVLRRRIAALRRNVRQATEQRCAELARAGATDLDELRQRLSKAVEIEPAAREAARLEREIAQLIVGHARGSEIRQLLEQRSAEEIEEQHKQVKHSLAELDSQLKLAQSAKPAIHFDHAGTREVAQLRLRLETVEEQIRRAIRRSRAVGLASSGLAELSPNAPTRAVAEGASRYLRALSEGSYQTLGAESSGDWYLEDARRRRISWHEVTEIADRRNAALALRMTMIDSLAHVGRNMPLVMGADHVVNYNGPSVATANVLRQFARNHQVLLVTHHADVAEWYESQGVPVVSIYRAAEFPKQPPANGTPVPFTGQELEPRQDDLQAIEYTPVPVARPRPNPALVATSHLPSTPIDEDAQERSLPAPRERDPIPVEYQTIRHTPISRENRLNEVTKHDLTNGKNGSTSADLLGNGHQPSEATARPVAVAPDDPPAKGPAENANGQGSDASELPDWWPD